MLAHLPVAPPLCGRTYRCPDPALADEDETKGEALADGWADGADVWEG